MLEAAAIGVSGCISRYFCSATAVRMCKLRGVSLDVAAKLLGHSSVLTTSKLYGRLDVSDLQNVYDRLIGTERP